MVRYEVNAYDFQSGLKEINWYIRKSGKDGIVYDGDKMTARIQKVGPSHITRISACHGTRYRRGHVHPINNKYLWGLKRKFLGYLFGYLLPSFHHGVTTIYSAQYLVLLFCMSLFVNPFRWHLFSRYV